MSERSDLVFICWFDPKTQCTVWVKDRFPEIGELVIYKTEWVGNPKLGRYDRVGHQRYMWLCSVYEFLSKRWEETFVVTLPQGRKVWPLGFEKFSPDGSRKSLGIIHRKIADKIGEGVREEEPGDDKLFFQ
jgi:hypothetical protein